MEALHLNPLEALDDLDLAMQLLRQSYDRRMGEPTLDLHTKTCRAYLALLRSLPSIKAAVKDGMEAQARLQAVFENRELVDEGRDEAMFEARRQAAHELLRMGLDPERAAELRERDKREVVDRAVGIAKAVVDRVIATPGPDRSKLPPNVVVMGKEAYIDTHRNPDGTHKPGRPPKDVSKRFIPYHPEGEQA